MSSNAKARVKKEENGDTSDDDFIDEKPIAARRPNAKPSASKKAKEETEDGIEAPMVKRNPASAGSDKKKGVKKEKEEEEVKGVKMVVKKEKKVVKKEKKVVKKEKKVYEMPGQKRDPPDERDPLRIFYESLYEQVPTSEMAQIWMMESGLLSADVANEVLEKKQKKCQTLKSPAKTLVSAKKTTTTTKSATVKRELSSTTKITKSVTVTKREPSSADANKKTKTPDTKISSKPSNKRKTLDDDASDENDSDDDFKVISQLKKRKLAG